jgi:hypothetical protein
MSEPEAARSDLATARLRDAKPQFRMLRGMRLRQAVMRDDIKAGEQTTRRINASVAAAIAFSPELWTLRSMHALSACARVQKRCVRLSHLRALACVLVVSGCAGSSPQPETRTEPVHTPAQMCHVDRALLIPAHAPDCGFGRAELKTVDPEQWSHLKLEFERKCYQTAEKAVRERLRRLQAAAKCEIESAQR